MRHFILFLTISTGIHWSASAQNTFNYAEAKKTTYLQYGIEPTYTIAVGYMHAFDVSKINRKVIAYGELSSPIRLFGVNNYEVKAGGILNVIRKGNFGISYNLNFSTGHVQTKNFDSQKIAFSNKALIGLFKQKWYVALSGAYEKIAANKIVHSQYYRDFIFPEAKDGWYKGAGGNIQIGVETGVTIKDFLDVRFELKVPRSETFQSYNGSPGHINLSVGYRF